MSRNFKSLFSAVVASGACLLLLLGQMPVRWNAPAATVLAAQPGQLTWYRGNLHTHTLWSDGDDYPEMVAAWYRDHGYDFLGFTDHNVLAVSEKWTDVLKNKGGQIAYDKLKARFPKDWVEERMTGGRLEVRLKRFVEVAAKLAVPKSFLLIQGEEITDKFARLPIHMNGTNVRETLPPSGGDSVYDVMQRNTDALVAQRERTGQPMLIHLNHPNFGYGVTAEDLLRVRGENFFEVYNGHPEVRNDGDDLHASTERIWDIILTKRLGELRLPVMYGLATDDGHNYHKIPSRGSEPGRGWVMVLADELSPAELIAALELGRFYASSGVALKRVQSDSTGLELEIDPQAGAAYEIEFVGTRKGYDPAGTPVTDKAGKPVLTTQRYSADIGRVLKSVRGTTARYEFQADDIYVRVRVISSLPHPNPSSPGEPQRAWVQPALGPAASR